MSNNLGQKRYLTPKIKHEKDNISLKHVRNNKKGGRQGRLLEKNVDDWGNMDVKEARSQNPGGYEGYGEDMNERKEVEDIGVETEDVEEVLLIAESIVKSYQHVDCGQTARTATAVLPMARTVWRSVFTFTFTCLVFTFTLHKCGFSAIRNYQRKIKMTH